MWSALIEGKFRSECCLAPVGLANTDEVIYTGVDVRGYLLTREHKSG